MHDPGVSFGLAWSHHGRLAAGARTSAKVGLFGFSNWAMAFLCLETWICQWKFLIIRIIPTKGQNQKRQGAKPGRSNSNKSPNINKRLLLTRWTSRPKKPREKKKKKNENNDQVGPMNGVSLATAHGPSHLLPFHHQALWIFSGQAHGLAASVGPVGPVPFLGSFVRT